MNCRIVGVNIVVDLCAAMSPALSGPACRRLLRYFLGVIYFNEI
jgi:hypothetical protein